MDDFAALLPTAPQALAFALMVLVLNATPGVDLLLTASRTLQAGPRAGVAAALGITLGCGVHAALAAFGLAALLALHAQALRAVQWAGALYLLWLGAGLLHAAWRDRGGAGLNAGGDPVPARPWTSDLRTGLVTNLLNPKVVFFFLSFLPQFVPAGAAHPTLAMALLGAWFLVQSLVFLLAFVGLLALAARCAPGAGRAAPRLRRGLQALGGLLFMGLAVRLASGDPMPSGGVR